MSSISTMGQSQAQIERMKTLQTQLSDLQYQLASGKKGRLFKDLEAGALTSKRARAEIRSLETYVTNIDIADRRIKLMTMAIQEIQTQASELENLVVGGVQEGDIDFEVLHAVATNIHDFIADIINTRDGERYVFGGSEGGVAPLEKNGLFESFTNSRLTAWTDGTISTESLITEYRSRNTLNDTLLGYSAQISSAKSVHVRFDRTSELDYTLKGNADGLRNLLAATGMMKTLTNHVDSVHLPDDAPTGTTVPPGSNDATRAENFFALWNDLAAMINKSVKDLDTERFKLSQAQAQLDTIRKDHLQAQNLLHITISETEDADMSEVALTLNTLQIQLEAAYRVTASVSQLSLASFL